MSGAAALAGRAALRAGAGLVRVATPKSVLPIVAAIEPSYTTIPLPEDDHGRIAATAIDLILDAAEQNDAIAFGPGLGQSSALRYIVQGLLAQPNLKLVIDADGLNNLAALKGWPEKRNAQVILTPHPGEMRRVWLGLFREPLPAQRPDQALRLAQTTGAVVVLKGAATVVTDGDRLYVNTTGNPGMATAGSGDVLTGILVAFLGQKLPPFEAAVLATYVHGLAGDIAAEQLSQVSLIATDIIEALPQVFKRIQ